MWVKMNLFYQQAAEAFGQEEFFSEVCIKSPLDLVSNEFTKEELGEAMKKNGFKSNISSYLSVLKGRGKIKKVGEKYHKK